MIKENLETTIFFASIIYAIGMFCHVGFNILIFRQFSLEEVGTYGLIMSLGAFAGFVMDMGLSQILIRGFSQNSLSFSQAVVGSLTLRIPVLAITLGVLAFWLYFKSLLGAMEGVLLALAILAQSLIGFRAIAASWLRAHNRQNVANLVNILQPLGYFVIGLLLLYLDKLNLLWFFFGILLIEGAVTGLAFRLTNKVLLPLRIREYLNFACIKFAVTSLWKPSLIFVIVSFWSVVESRLDWLMVYTYASGTDLAYYSLANKVYEFFEAGICVLTLTSFPWMCKTILTGEKNPRIIIGFKGLAFIGMILAVAVILYLPSVLALFWGTKFEKANKMIFWLMCGAFLVPISSLMYYSLISIHKEKYLLLTSTIPALAQIAANLILIPRYGGLGATFGMIIMIFTSFMLLSIYSVKTNILELGVLIKLSLIFLMSITLLSLDYFLNLKPLNSSILIITIILLSLLMLFSRSEWSVVSGDLKAIIKSATKWHE
jgi:O-antigen/teichoic acid export membrane protein